MSRLATLAALLAPVTVLCGMDAAKAGSFTFTSLDVPGQTASAAGGIDAQGRVVGQTTDAAGVTHGMVWQAGATTLVDAPGKGTVLGAINSAGAVAGTSASATVPDGVFREGLATSARTPFLADKANAYTVAAMNRAGTVVGFAQTAGFSFSAFATAGRRLSLLAVPGATLSYAFAINSGGTIVGQYADSAYKQHGFSLSNGAFTSVDTTLPLAVGTGLVFINDAGLFGGTYLTDSCSLATCPANMHGFVRRAGVDTAYDFPGGHRATQVVGLGEAGEVVGNFWDPTADSSLNIHGFIYRGGAYRRIDMPGATYTTITAVNQAGSIAGTYVDSQHVQHGFVAICPAHTGACLN